MSIDRISDLDHPEPRVIAETSLVKEAPAEPETRVVAATFNAAPAAAAPDDDFLDMMGGDEPDHSQGYHQEMEVEEEGPQAVGTASMQVEAEPELEARALVAERDIRQELPLENSTQALALAAMPHYDLGGKPGVVVGKAEMRFLLAEAEATVRGPEQNAIERVEAKPSLDWSHTSPQVQASHHRAEEVVRMERTLLQATKAAMDNGVEEPVAYRFAALVSSGRQVSTSETSELARDLHETHPEELRKAFEETVADLDGLVRDFRTRLEAQENTDRTQRIVLDPVQMADRNIDALVKSGYIEPIKATPEVKDAVLRVNDYLKEAAPKNWNLLSEAEPTVAYRLTDAGIAAGRSVRSWNGDDLEAGLVRLPKGEALPPEVSSDSYSVAAMMMENKANAGILKPGEMGAFLRAEMDSIAYDAKQGLIRPAVAMGRVEGILEGSTDSAIQQIEMGHTAESAPLSVRDMEGLAARARTLIDSLPDFQKGGADPGWLNKNRAYTMAADLDGIAIGNKLILYDLQKASEGADMTRPESWSEQKTTTPSSRATLSTVKLWLDEVAESAEAARRELAAMAEGVFGEQGKAVAARIA